MLGIFYDLHNAFNTWNDSFPDQVRWCLSIAFPLWIFYLGLYFSFLEAQSLKIIGVLLASLGFIAYLTVELLIAFGV